MGINFDILTNWGTTGAQGSTPSGTQQTGGPAFSDKIVSLGGLRINFNYTQGTGNPALPYPDENASTEVPPRWGDIRTPVHQHAYLSSFSVHLEHFAHLYNLSDQQVNMIVFSQMTGEPIPDETFLNDLLGKIEDKVAEEMMENYGEDSFPSLRDQAKALKRSGGTALNSSLEKIQQLQEYVNTLPEGAEKQKLQQFINEIRNSLSGLDQTMQQLENAADRGQLSDLINELKQKIEGLYEKLENVHSLSNDPFAGASLSDLVETVQNGFNPFSDDISEADKNNQLAQGNWSILSSDVGEIFLNRLNASFHSSFEEALSRYATENNLSEEEVAQIRFAHFNPEAVTDPKIKGLLGEINTLALGMMSENWGMPPGYVPTPDSTYFNAEIEQAFDDAFKQVLLATHLKTFAKQFGMTEADVKGIIEYLHFHPELTEELINNNDMMKKLLGLKDGEQLQKILNKLAEVEGKAFNEIAKKYGLPPGFKATPGKISFDAKVNGRFVQQFDYNLRNHEPPLSQEEIREVRAALSDPMNPSISAETKSMIQNLYNLSVDQIRNEYNLPVGWAPPVTLLSSAANIPQHFRTMLSAAEFATESLKLMATYVEQMPDNPSKALLINTMKIISEAIAELKARIAELLIIDSQIATKLSEAQKEAALWKIELEKRKIEKQRKAAKKAGKMKGLQKAMGILGPIMKVAMVVVAVAIAVATGGAASALIALAVAAVVIASVIEQIVTGENFLDKMFQELQESMPKPLGLIISLIIVVGVGMAIGGIGGLMMGMMLAFEHARVVQEAVLLFTDNQMAAEIVAMVVQLIAEIIFAIALTIFTGGTAGAAMVANIAGKAAQMAAKTVQTVVNLLMRFANTASRIGRMVEKVASQLTKIATKLQHFADKMDDLIKNLDNVNKQISSLKKAQKAGEQVDDQLRALKEVKSNLVNKITGKMDLFDRFIKATEYIKLGLNVATSIEQARLSFIQADLARILAALDAEIEVLETLIKMLRKVINKIFEAIESQVKWMGDIGRLQNKIWSDLTHTTSTIASATEG